MTKQPMAEVFSRHIVMCGWNQRAPHVVRALKSLSIRPILILHTRVAEVIAAVGTLHNVFVMPGDATDREMLLKADVARAHSVIVLASEELGSSADARSVQIALAVERIESAVYTVVELTSIQNKRHFAWTKVDDLVTDQGISVRMMAQGIRTALDDKTNVTESFSRTYRELVEPGALRSQLFRVDIDYAAAHSIPFGTVLRHAVRRGLVPVALVGYRRHENAHADGESVALRHTRWITWKSDVRSNPPSDSDARSLWPSWPKGNFPLGILVIAKSKEHAAPLASDLLKQSAGASG